MPESHTLLHDSIRYSNRIMQQSMGLRHLDWKLNQCVESEVEFPCAFSSRLSNASRDSQLCMAPVNVCIRCLAVCSWASPTVTAVWITLSETSMRCCLDSILESNHATEYGPWTLGLRTCARTVWLKRSGFRGPKFCMHKSLAQPKHTCLRDRKSVV